MALFPALPGQVILEDAIHRHDEEAHDAARQFRELRPEAREDLIAFLHTL
jgi:hypothetical protein